MAYPRFLVESLTSTESETIELDVPQQRHACNVLRLRAGSPVILFDGRGGEATGEIATIDKRSATVRVVERTDTDRELPRSLELFVALPKGDRQRTLTESLVQLGAARLTPLITRRSVAQPTENALQRLRRTVVETSKQCGRNRLMVIGAPLTIDDCAHQANSTRLQVFAHPHGQRSVLADLRPAAPSGQVVIGPEGGLHDDECEMLQSTGWIGVCLGPRILRVETAAMLLASWWAASATDR